ncbi:alpha/beta fold hydrolase [Luteibacter sahnii]|uniref:alpha/beta fold hydrolase n=1 Tax=Luteibacter sahnii TaxID=3021977 RepID=UPI002A6B026B|nr:alpha/beta hydrolase [Luteibacter sp. PPL193]MDY1547701.1 alpha/beta hydrolase [Luteibacter sp. PPL193]
MAPILLIHGLFGSLRSPAIVSAFGDVRVLAPDLIGYGAFRDGAPEAWTLQDQADHVACWLSARVNEPVNVVGHSVGGAVSVLFARRHPELTRSLTSVEGNMTLGDAFWSRKIADRPLAEVEVEIAGFRADVAGWIARSGLLPTPLNLATASGWLDNQPASTIRAQARAVVAATGEGAFLDELRVLAESGVPIHLLAGAHSRAGWSVPDWLAQKATTHTVIPGTGHLMMLEQPTLFASAVLANLAIERDALHP